MLRADAGDPRKSQQQFDLFLWVGFGQCVVGPCLNRLMFDGGSCREAGETVCVGQVRPRDFDGVGILPAMKCFQRMACRSSLVLFGVYFDRLRRFVADVRNAIES